MTRSTHSRGVSEILGYILIFSMVISSVGILYISGVGSITEYRDIEQSNNADRAFVALATSIEDVHRGSAPQRAGEIRLGEGTLAVDDSTALAAKVADDNGVLWSKTIGENSLTYQYDKTTIRYETGAVIRSNSEWSTVSKEPPFQCSPDYAIVSSLSIQEQGDISSISESGTVLVSTKRDTVDAKEFKPSESSDPYTVTLSVSSDAPQAWNSYLTESGWIETTDGSYECTAERVLVRDTQISVEILR